MIPSPIIIILATGQPVIVLNYIPFNMSSIYDKRALTIFETFCLTLPEIEPGTYQTQSDCSTTRLLVLVVDFNVTVLALIVCVEIGLNNDEATLPFKLVFNLIETFFMWNPYQPINI